MSKVRKGSRKEANDPPPPLNDSKAGKKRVAEAEAAPTAKGAKKQKKISDAVEAAVAEAAAVKAAATSEKKTGKKKKLLQLKDAKDEEKQIVVVRKKVRAPRGAPAIVPNSVLYLGHIPSSFAEAEIRRFFSQFGKVVNSKLFRSKTSAKSKGYAFIQFDSTSDAAVVAEAMNAYLLEGRCLQCHVVPEHKLHKGMFLPNKISKKVTSGKGVESEETEESTGPEGEDESEDEEEHTDPIVAEKRARKMLEKQSKLQKKLSKLGIDFDVLLVHQKGGAMLASRIQRRRRV